jgi:hypothetical protein
MTTTPTKARRQLQHGPTIGPLGPGIHILFQEHDDAGTVVTKYYCCLAVHRDDDGETKFRFASEQDGTNNEPGRHSTSVPHPCWS